MIKWLIKKKKTFFLRTKECRIKFNSSFSSIKRLFLLIMTPKPLLALTLGHYTEYYLVIPSFLIRILEDFDISLRNEDKDLL